MGILFSLSFFSDSSSVGPSPRKKPRKQLMSQRNSNWSDAEEQPGQQQTNQQGPHLLAGGKDDKKRKIPGGEFLH